MPRQRWRNATSVARADSGTPFRRESLPGPEEWAATLPDLRPKGRGAWAGPCPLCFGTDRFHVETERNGRARVGCRGCIDGRPALDRARRFGEILRAVFPNLGPRPQGCSRGYSPRSARQPATNAATLRERARTNRAESADDPKIACARRIWESAILASGTQAHRYLAERFAWPCSGPALPASVRWLAAERAPPTDRAASWFGLPDGAAGAVIYRFDRRGEALGAVQCEALNADSGRLQPERWRRTTGSMAGALFEATTSDGPVIVFAEGPVTALACRWQHPGARCLATGGTGGLRLIDPAALDLPEAARIVIEADCGRAGDKAAEAAEDRFPSARVVWRREGDTADDLADDITERAAIIEFDGGTDRRTAEAAAWQPIISRIPADER